MRIECPTCAKTYNLPPDKAAIPGLTVRCHCGAVFTVADAVAPDRAPAPAPAPVPPPVPVPAAAPAHAAPSAPEAPRAPRRPPPWPRCANHHLVRSSHVCPTCVKGYCEACTQKVQGGAICAQCDGLCVPAQEYGRKQDMADQRQRTMAQDVPIIFGYPLKDPLAFVLLALFTWVFGYVANYLAQGVLMLYAFHALTRVSIGDLKSTMPDFTDAFDLMHPARLAIAAFVISTGPLILVTLFVPGAKLAVLGASTDRTAVAHAAQPPAPAPETPEDAEEDEDDPEAEASPGPGKARNGHRERWQHEESMGAGAMALLAIALLWKLVYTPVALTVAALSRSYLSTLNPVIGIGTILRMGTTYWHAMVLYTVLAVAQLALGFGLDKIPLAGPLLRSFTDAYAELAIACTLGLAVFKKAKELAWD